MRTRRSLLVVLFAVLVAGCDYVKRAEFDEYKAHITAKGDSVNAHAAGVSKALDILNADWFARHCPAGNQDPKCSDPPVAPPPPPKGQW